MYARVRGPPGPKIEIEQPSVFPRFFKHARLSVVDDWSVLSLSVIYHNNFVYVYERLGSSVIVPRSRPNQPLCYEEFLKDFQRLNEAPWDATHFSVFFLLWIGFPLNGLIEVQSLIDCIQCRRPLRWRPKQVEKPSFDRGTQLTKIIIGDQIKAKHAKGWAAWPCLTSK